MSIGIDETVLVITRIFDAPRDRVFDAWMERAEWEAWIGPEGVKCTLPVMEPKVDGRYRLIMKMSTGQQMNIIGAYKTIERPSKIVFTWGPEDKPETTSTVTLTFRDSENGKTELTLRHDGLQTADNRDAHGKGWNSALNKLARYVRGETP
jgi:uncharacterized protein YndB with AHSA1/START domain